jgi:hypothetical protein
MKMRSKLTTKKNTKFVHTKMHDFRILAGYSEGLCSQNFQLVALENMIKWFFFTGQLAM